MRRGELGNEFLLSLQQGRGREMSGLDGEDVAGGGGGERDRGGGAAADGGTSCPRHWEFVERGIGG